VAHAYNPSYSGGRDQEDQGVKWPGQTIPQDSISKKKNITKKGWRSDSGVGPDYKPQHQKKPNSSLNKGRVYFSLL
jgi:hypothetical protein